MGLVQKEDVKMYWSTEELVSTPFFPNIMSRDEYHNHLTFFHLYDNNYYPEREDPDYNPRLKLGNLFSVLSKRFSELWAPHQHLSVDEGCIPFKGHIHFKCFNPNKPNKYHIKTFKVVDSVTKYCCEFDIYVGSECLPSLTPYGQIHDLVFRLCKNYFGKSHIYMDNWYSSPSLFYNLSLVQTGACGTSRYRVGYPKKFFKKCLKNRGDYEVINGNGITAMRIYDRKVFCILSTIYGTEFVEIGRNHWQTKVPIEKPAMLAAYNKYMGGVDFNDKLLQYSAYNRQSIKWWKKVAFRLLNLSMVNAYILYNYWRKSMGKSVITHTKFCINFIKQLLDTALEYNPPPLVPIVTDFSRLNGRHFIEKNPLIPPAKKAMGRCQVCCPAERRKFRLKGQEPPKRAGRESAYQCDRCKIVLCIGDCFKLYHTRENYVQRYIDIKNQ